MASSSSSPFQRPCRYVDFLPEPVQAALPADADASLSEILRQLKRAYADDNPPEEGPWTRHVTNWLSRLHAYLSLYHMRLSKADHILLIRLCYRTLLVPNLDSVSLEDVAILLTRLLRKKYLLSRDQDGLVLEWRPLYDLLHYWSNSTAAERFMIRPQKDLIDALRNVVKFGRSFFPDTATREILDEFRPQLCQLDRAFPLAFLYLSLFLPTNIEVPAALSRDLWLDEFLTLWDAFSNSPSWEIDLFALVSRLALHQAGSIDWTPHLERIFVRIMNTFNLPVTYANSNVLISHGMASTGDYRVFPFSARFIVSAMWGGRGTVQKYLTKMLLAVESYYHPSNINVSTEMLTVFMQELCAWFMRRLHMERHNKKWTSKTPVDRRLTDGDVTAFVESVKTIAFHLLYSPMEEHKRVVFNILATLRPQMILPDLLERFHAAVEMPTEPHRFTACVSALSAVDRPLVENYPAEAVDLLMVLVPGIDVNDITKASDNFILLSDLMEGIWCADFSKQAGSDEANAELLSRTRVFEDFAAQFTDACLRLVDNTCRQQTRHESDINDEALNDEEITLDTAVSDVYNKIMAKCSPNVFRVVFNKVKNYVSERIIEANVGGSILSGMCKSLVTAHPKLSLDFFVPLLCDRILAFLDQRSQQPGRQQQQPEEQQPQKADQELQFYLLLLSEVVSVRQCSYQSMDALLPHLDAICSVLDRTICLSKKDEYEMAMLVLKYVIHTLVHVRMLSDSMAAKHWPPSEEPLYKDYQWGKSASLDELKVNWYVPSEKEGRIVQDLIDKYLEPVLAKLNELCDGKVDMSKEELVRNLRQVINVVSGCSEMLEPLMKDDKTRESKTIFSVLPDSMAPVKFRLAGGRMVREGVLEVTRRVKTYLLTKKPDDTESLLVLIGSYNYLLQRYLLDDDDVSSQMEEYKCIKNHRLNRLVQSKQHLESVLMERIGIQYTMLQNFKLSVREEFVSREVVQDMFELATSHYADVRVTAQETLQFLMKSCGFSVYDQIVPELVKCLEDKPDVTHEMMKGALYLIGSETRLFCYEWGYARQLWPALVRAQHSDKPSVVDLLQLIANRTNRTTKDFQLCTLPVLRARPTPEVLQLLDVQAPMDTDDDAGVVDGDFVELERTLCQLLTTGQEPKLRWRHRQMAVGMMLSLVVPGHVKPREVVDLWLDLLVSDDRLNRNVAFQALEAVMKVSRRKRVAALETAPPEPPPEADPASRLPRPGIRKDNEWMQFRPMSDKELDEYWTKPFCVKNYAGYYTWHAGEDKPIKMRLVDEEDCLLDAAHIRAAFSERFNNPEFVSQFVDYMSVEHKKGADRYSTDRALFHMFLIENFNDAFIDVYLKHIETLIGSTEESKQRVAAEMSQGVIRGSRFWPLDKSRKLWKKLAPIVKSALQNLTTESLDDWCLCFSASTSRVDPNRQAWLYDLLLDESHLQTSKGTFRDSAYLRLLDKAISQNWRLRSLYRRVYAMLEEYADHPYHEIRRQVSNLMGTLVIMDVPYGGKGGQEWNMGAGFPTRTQIIEGLLPKLSLNTHHPEFNGLAAGGGGGRNGGDKEDEAAAGKSSEAAMEVDAAASSSSSEDSPSTRALKTASLWTALVLNGSSIALSPDLYRLLPFLCQYVDTDAQEQHEFVQVSQFCIQALCFLSASYAPPLVFPAAYDMFDKLTRSPSWRAKLSMLEFVQVFVFHNFVALATSQEYKKRTETVVLALLTDESLQVRQKAKEVICGMIHSHFLDEADQTRLDAFFRAKIRTKMARTKAGKSAKSAKSASTSSPARFKRVNVAGDRERLADYHSGVLGLCALVDAAPYDVPKYVPDILVQLERHLHDPQPIPKTIKDCFREFKRTHQDNWAEHKQKFTDDQLSVLTDLLVSPNYYA